MSEAMRLYLGLGTLIVVAMILYDWKHPLKQVKKVQRKLSWSYIEPGTRRTRTGSLLQLVKR